MNIYHIIPYVATALMEKPLTDYQVNHYNETLFNFCEWLKERVTTYYPEVDYNHMLNIQTAFCRLKVGVPYNMNYLFKVTFYDPKKPLATPYGTATIYWNGNWKYISES